MRNPSFSPEQQSSPEIANFNNAILIKVTEAGEKMWDEHFAAARIALGEPNLKNLKRDEEGYTKISLSDFAYIFGEGMRSGSRQLPVEMIYKTVPELDQ